MTWIQFTGWISSLYICYYLVILVLDNRRLQHNKTGEAMSEVLTFPGEEIPQVVSPIETPAQKAQPDVISSGGVTLKSLFTLAREEAIIYTRPVSF
ncbi:hypothetical protein EOD41_14870 [Mucilaginibacter limnophilus]|uniref:Uncharacterized protein n=1 Tax=Mucilaginibacter limnophilus TaxID=1932778 RepID=A0A437MQ07_9SPHI|nr:hypothetical protein [Mucilaginibacter limnophilus]RVT99724.1 hypothetical protein EOD41_14870 [Mucilaginibacter limnophilus]